MLFSIHGWEVEIANGSWRFQPELVGNVRRRGATGTLAASRRGRKGTWNGATVLMVDTALDPVNLLLSGEHDVFAFDADVYSSKARGWSTVPTLDALNKKFGESSMSAASGSTYTTDYTDTTTRTVLLWRRPNSGAFNHYALSLSAGSIAAQWKNGVTTVETVTNWFTPAADGSFSLLGKDDAGANSIAQYDDVVILPFAATQEQVTAWAAQTRGWAEAPFLNCSGSGFAPHAGAGEPNVVAYPEVESTSFVQGVEAGSFEENLQSLSFTLAEV